MIGMSNRKVIANIYGEKVRLVKNVAITFKGETYSPDEYKHILSDYAPNEYCL